MGRRRVPPSHRIAGLHRLGPGGLVVAVLVLLLIAGALAWHALLPGPQGGPGAGPSSPASPPEGDEPAPPDQGGPATGPGKTPAAGDDGTPSAPPGADVQLETVATGLEVPWDMAFDAQGRLFFTERPGRINLLDGGRVVTLVTLPDTVAVGESGLLGIALHPGFPEPPYVYVYQTYRARGGGAVVNRILRFRFEPGTPQASSGKAAGDGRAVEGRDQGQDQDRGQGQDPDQGRRGPGQNSSQGAGPRLTGRQVIVDGIPASSIHDGGQLEFGPDGKLYVTTGDARAADRVQDPDSLHGKILRLNPDGSIPRDNPLGPGNPVYSYGHRNPEGLAFDPATGRLYAVEHGPDAWDEVNRIEPGANYGWPEAVAPAQHRGRFTPALRSYDPIIAPAGAAFYRGPIRGWDGSLFFGTLGFQPDSPGRHLHRLRLDPTGTRVVEEEVLFKGEFGRIRSVQTGPDGCLYFGTSNRDGRGEPSPLDDRILRLCPMAGT